MLARADSPYIKRAPLPIVRSRRPEAGRASAITLRIITRPRRTMGIEERAAKANRPVGARTYEKHQYMHQRQHLPPGPCLGSRPRHVGIRSRHVSFLKI